MRLRTQTQARARAGNVNGNGVKSEHTQQTISNITTCLTDQNSQNQKLYATRNLPIQVQLCPIHICIEFSTPHMLHLYCINDHRMVSLERSSSERTSVHRKRADKKSDYTWEWGAFNYLFKLEPTTDPTTKSSKSVLNYGELGFNIRYNEQFNVC